MSAEQKQYADRIVAYLKKLNGLVLSLTQIDKEITGKNIVGFAPTKPIISVLTEKGILFGVKQTFQSGHVTNEDMYVLTDLGWLYESYD